ncbi:IS200/IS605 family transposase [Parabacteroides chinchillae]
MAYVKIIVHCVWSTKNRLPQLVNRAHRIQLFEHIRINALSKGIFIDQIGGEKEHVHCLVSLGSEQNIAKVIQLIKGESAFWFNRKWKCKLEWQDDYFAVSVSESILDKIRKYIQNQEEHHKRKSFNEEYSEFILRYSFG